ASAEILCARGAYHAVSAGRSSATLEVMTSPDVTATLDAGAKIIGAIIAPYGFLWTAGPTHRGHPGDSDSGNFTRGDRPLELHYRWSLSIVPYHLGDLALSHISYMRHSGHKSDARYPGFSSDPLDAFRDLAYDLTHFSTDFLSGSGESFRDAVIAARESPQVSGFKALP